MRLLTDPVLRSRVMHLRRHAEAPGADFETEIDAVLISHIHYDHLDLPSLRRLDRETPLIVPAGAGGLLRRAGFDSVTELRAGEATTVRARRGGLGSTAGLSPSTGGEEDDRVEVHAVPARHSGRRRPLGIEAETIGFEIHGSRRVYFAGDTDFFPELSEISGGLEVALLPIWGWGTSVGPGHMDPVAAARAAAVLDPAVSVPIHWGTFFPIGMRRWRGDLLVTPPERFSQALREADPALKARILRPGGHSDH